MYLTRASNWYHFQAYMIWWDVTFQFLYNFLLEMFHIEYRLGHGSGSGWEEGGEVRDAVPGEKESAEGGALQPHVWEGGPHPRHRAVHLAPSAHRRLYVPAWEIHLHVGTYFFIACHWNTLPSMYLRRRSCPRVLKRRSWSELWSCPGLGARWGGTRHLQPGSSTPQSSTCSKPKSHIPIHTPLFAN